MNKWFKNLSQSCRILQSDCPIGSVETGKIGMLRRAKKVSAFSVCPIDLQEAVDFAVLSGRRSDQGKQPGEAMKLVAQVSVKAQQQIRQQRGPDLPFEGAFAVTQKIGLLKGLFEFFEKDFKAAAATIKGDYSFSASFEVVDQQIHFPKSAVHLDQGDNSAQFDGINFLDSRDCLADQVIAQNVFLGFVLKFSDAQDLKVVIGAGDPADLAHGEACEVFKVHIFFVKDHDFAHMHMDAKVYGADAVMLGVRVYDSSAGQLGLQRNPEVAFGSDFASAMFGSVHGAAHQPDGSGVQDVYETLEAGVEVGWAAITAKSGLQDLQVFLYRPEQVVGHFVIADEVSMREGVFRKGSGATQGRQRSPKHSQGVADVVELQTVGELGVEQTDNVAPRTKEVLDLPCWLGGRVGTSFVWNEVANLAQLGELTGGWRGCGFLFDTLPCCRRKPASQPFFAFKPQSKESGAISVLEYET